jgi:hypothetical protein
LVYLLPATLREREIGRWVGWLDKDEDKKAVRGVTKLLFEDNKKKRDKKEKKT